MSKLTEKQIAEIRDRYASTQVSHRTLAEEYGVSRTTINRILNSSYAEKERERKRERNKQNRHMYKVKPYQFTLHLENDADIIEKLDSVENRQGFIKQAIRNELKKEQS